MPPLPDQRYLLRALGTVELHTAQGEAVQRVLRQPKRLAVLVYLATARPAGFHRRDKLAALFWPELGTERARGALRTTLSRLRQDLGEDTVVARGNDEVALDESRFWVDVVAIADALRAGDLDAAWSLYRGPFCDALHVEGASEEFESWLSAERLRLHTILRESLVKGAEAAAAAGAYEAAFVAAQRALTLAPTDEQAARSVIRAQLARGDRGGALNSFEALRVALWRTYEIEPSAITAALVSDLRGIAGGPTGVPVAAAPQDRETERPPMRAERSDIAATLTTATGAPTTKTRGPRRRTYVAIAATVLLALLFSQQSAPATQSPHRWERAEMILGRREARGHPLALIDSTRHGLLVVGGLHRVEPLSLADDALRMRGIPGVERGEWVTDSVAGEGPTERWLVGAGTDLERDLAVTFGGASGTTLPCHSDLWVLRNLSGRADVPRWQPVSVIGPQPSPRADVHAFFDASRRELITVGGTDCVDRYFPEVWLFRFADSTLTRGSWVQVPVPLDRPSPEPRTNFIAEYDADHGRLILYGGRVAGALNGDIWVMSGVHGGPVEWTKRRCADEPPPRAHAASVWDARTETMLLIGGIGPKERELAETWRLSVPAADARCRWERLETGAEHPVARYASTAHFDPRERRVILYGGMVGAAAIADVWTIEDPFRRP